MRMATAPRRARFGPIALDATAGPQRPRVVIVGAGFAGLFAAKALAHTPVDVVVVDRRNHHVFQPLLYQVATAGLNASDVAHPIRSILRDQANASVLLASVTDIDLAARTVTLDHDETLCFDKLVLATGAGHSYFGHDHWAMHAPGLKTVEDALEIRRRVLSAFEAAEREPDPGRRQTLLAFVVVGGGPTGVELAGAISEIAQRTIARDFRTIDSTTSRIVLVEAQDRILATYPGDLSVKATLQLRRLGVEVRTSCRVLDIDDVGIDTTSGRIDSATVLWAAGVAASPLARCLDAPLDRSGRVQVGSDLTLPNHRDVFVIGDLAAITDADGRLVPGVAPAAMQAGRHVASTITADLRGQPRRDFAYRDKGSLATIGRSSAVADLGRWGRYSGFGAWVLWWLIHLLYLNGFRNRLMVWFGWAWQWLTFERGARLITGRQDPATGPTNAAGHHR